MNPENEILGAGEFFAQEPIGQAQTEQFDAPILNRLEAASFACVVLYTSMSLDLRDQHSENYQFDIVGKLRECRDHIIKEYKLTIAEATVIASVASQFSLDVIRMPSGIFTEKPIFTPVSYRFLKESFDALKTTYGRVIVSKILSMLTMDNVLQKDPTKPHYIMSGYVVENARHAASQDVYLTCGHIIDSITATLHYSKEDLDKALVNYAPEIRQGVYDRVAELKDILVNADGNEFGEDGL